MDELSRKAEIERKLTEVFADAKSNPSRAVVRDAPLSQSISGNNNVQIAGSLQIGAGIPHGRNLIPCPECSRPVSSKPGSQCPGCGCAVGLFLENKRAEEAERMAGIGAVLALIALAIGANMHTTHWLPEFVRSAANYLIIGAAAVLFLCAQLLSPTNKR